jgi:RNA polymerase sigma factor (sigma-70 family)
MLLRDGAGLTDEQLLTDFISRRDEAALAVLVHRHAPMVWGVCRRVLRSHHDAEDAFQATFLVLVRKAALITSRELLANWLYGVAHQTAVKARATTGKRKVREKQVAEMPEPVVAEQDKWPDVQLLLDQELSRLPDKYRAVIVLCDLEDKSRKEAAQLLDLPEGTVGSRLARARVMLAKRLVQRGVVVSGGALATMLIENVASAGVPNMVVSSTIKAASIYAAGPAAAAGVISAKVVALTEGVLKAMLFTKLKAMVAVVLTLGFVASGATILTSRTAAGQDDKKPTAGNASAGQIKVDPDLLKLPTGKLELEITVAHQFKVPVAPQFKLKVAPQEEKNTVRVAHQFKVPVAPQFKLKVAPQEEKKDVGGNQRPTVGNPPTYRFQSDVARRDASEGLNEWNLAVLTFMRALPGDVRIVL